MSLLTTGFSDTELRQCRLHAPWRKLYMLRIFVTLKELTATQKLGMNKVLSGEDVFSLDKNWQRGVYSLSIHPGHWEYASV